MSPVNQNSSSRRPLFTQIAAGLCCIVLYGFLAVESRLDTGIELFNFLGGYWLIAAVLLLYWYYLYDNDLSISFRSVIIWAVIFRLIAIYGSPILEDDFYRYLLDGCLFISSGSPYGISPSSLFQSNSLSAECRSALTWVNNPDIPTIYGPVLQYVFALAHLLSPANITPLQIILALFDIGVILLLSQLTHARNVLLYAWNPLVLKEVVFTAHPDIIGVFLLLLAFVMRRKNYDGWACLFIAIACATKVFALLALPFFLYRAHPKFWGLIALTIALLYTPFLLQGQTDMLVLGIFVERWVFNATVFQLFAHYLPDLAARLLCLGLYICWWLYYFYRYQSANSREIPRMEWVFGLFFLLSPVANAWYLVWLLPFATLRSACWPWVAALMLSLTYVTGLNLINSNLGAYQMAQWAINLEIALIVAAIYYDFREGRLKFSQT